MNILIFPVFFVHSFAYFLCFCFRVGNVGRLSVNKLSSSPNPDQVAEASTSHNSIRSDLVDDVDLFIAGVPSDYEVSPYGIDSTIGCLDNSNANVHGSNFFSAVNS